MFLDPVTAVFTILSGIHAAVQLWKEVKRWVRQKAEMAYVRFGDGLKTTRRQIEEALERARPRIENSYRRMAILRTLPHANSPTHFLFFAIGGPD